jgi:hypothetical protein
VSVAGRVRVHEIDDDEEQRLSWIVRGGTGSVVTWRRTRTVLLSAQGIPVAETVEVTFTSADRARDVIHTFNADGFEALCPKCEGGRPRMFTLPERREIKAMGAPPARAQPGWGRVGAAAPRRRRAAQTTPRPTPTRDTHEHRPSKKNPALRIEPPSFVVRMVCRGGPARR